MRVAVKPSAADLKRASLRAQEWKEFRQQFLFSQGHLAAAIHRSKRTVNGIENCEIIWPTAGTLRQFQTLKRKHEDNEAERLHKEALREAELQNAYPQSQRRRA